MTISDKRRKQLKGREQFKFNGEGLELLPKTYEEAAKLLEVYRGTNPFLEIGNLIEDHNYDIAYDESIASYVKAPSERQYSQCHDASCETCRLIAVETNAIQAYKVASIAVNANHNPTFQDYVRLYEMTLTDTHIHFLFGITNYSFNKWQEKNLVESPENLRFLRSRDIGTNQLMELLSINRVKAGMMSRAGKFSKESNVESFTVNEYLGKLEMGMNERTIAAELEVDEKLLKAWVKEQKHFDLLCDEEIAAAKDVGTAVVKERLGGV